MEKRPDFLLLLSSCIAFGQEKMERIAPQDHRFYDILGELGNPLLGRLIMVINYRVIHEGSCLFYLNEAKAKNLFYFIEKPYDLRAGVYLEDHGVLLERRTRGTLTQPRYLLNQCIATDADYNSTEFYPI